MNVILTYYGQLWEYAKTESEKLSFDKEVDLVACLAKLEGRYNSAFWDIIFDRDGGLRPSLIVLVNGLPVDTETAPALADGDEVTLLAAISGG